MTLPSLSSRFKLRQSIVRDVTDESLDGGQFVSPAKSIKQQLGNLKSKVTIRYFSSMIFFVFDKNHHLLYIYQGFFDQEIHIMLIF